MLLWSWTRMVGCHCQYGTGEAHYPTTWQGSNYLAEAMATRGPSSPTKQPEVEVQRLSSQALAYKTF